MTNKIADLRNRHPIQYLHLLRAGYFEPIPVAWANQASNPLKFSIEATAGWRGITPTWRGYEDTAEERLYWVLNHREGSVGMRMKPDFISEMDMARARMARAVAPPPEYYSANDTCHLQHTSTGYSKQVMPTPFVAYDRPEVPTDDTMILLDVSGSMDFDPVWPNYNQYLITGYSRSTQPKNKGIPKSSPKPPSILILYRCCESHHPTLHRCDGKPRPRLPWLRPYNIFRQSYLHWHSQSSESQFNVAQGQNWRWNASHDRLANGQGTPFQKAFRVCNPSSRVRMASWT